MKKVVAYFSASGTTAEKAKALAKIAGADLKEIVPKEKYTFRDLNWMDKKSRSSLESADEDCRPAIEGGAFNLSGYDRVYIGFPIWWYVAPTIINTFLESYDLTGKTIIPFATSGGSDMGKTNEKLLPSCKGAKLLNGKVFKASVSGADLAKWAEGLENK